MGVLSRRLWSLDGEAVVGLGVVDAGRDSLGMFLSSSGVLELFECVFALRDAGHHSSTCSYIESPESQWQCHLGRYPHGVLENSLLRISRSLRMSRERGHAVSVLRLSLMARIAPKGRRVCPHSLM